MEFYSPQQQSQQQQQQPGDNMASGATADAATVAIAKDMLQLHHGGAHVSHAEHLPPTQEQQVGVLAPAPAEMPDNAFGILKFENDMLYITDSCTIIGRNSSTSHVHFHVAENNLVSRKHFQVLFDADCREFFVQCLSKNGIFVDDFLQRRNADPLKLPKSCAFRFPSTEIRILFESYVHEPAPAAHNTGALHAMGNHCGNTNVIVSAAADSAESHATANLLPLEASNIIYSPLKISIPKKDQKSPYLSPTGTISAANSCPASPRQGFHQNPNYNNYANNNLQNQDLFQTPSTASYNHNEKPPYSYAQLIVQAISAAPDKQLTLSGIYSFIVKHYPYYRKETNKGWQNSIRHNLSLNRYFIKVARSQDEPGKGSFWRIDPDSGAKLIDHSYKKRRQRSSQGFRPSYGMPRSAPVSPSHMDNSRESSPLQDIVLQSAPGSPGISLENRNAEDLIYGNQNVHQQPANNSQHQYNSGSPYYVTNQNNAIGGGSVTVMGQAHVENSGGNGVGALIALKRNHVMAAAAPNSALSLAGHQQQQQQQQQHQLQHHPDIIYEEMPTDYSGNIESGDECDAAKRPKYISEVL